MNQKSDQYRILEPLAIGGMAKVDLGEHLQDGTKVVFKRIRTDFKQKPICKPFCGRATESPIGLSPCGPHGGRWRRRERSVHDFESIDGTDLEEVFANHKKQDKPLPLKTALLIFHIGTGSHLPSRTQR